MWRSGMLWRCTVVALAPAALAGAIAAESRGTPTFAAALQDSCTPQPIVPIGEGFFTDISAQSGIQDENYLPERGISSNDHSRLGFVDLNGDGYDDVVMHNMTGNVNAKPFEHLVFLNNGDGTFDNFSDESGLRNSQTAFLAFGDVDGDGDQDAFGGVDKDSRSISGLLHELYLNDGSGHFTLKEDSGLEGIAGTMHVAGNAIFADFNGDTYLDMYLGNGATVAGKVDQLFFGNGDGTFRDVSRNLQPAISRASNGSVACDYDDDGDLDIFVSVYGVSLQLGANVLFENDGRGNFRDVAVERGFASQPTGNYLMSETGYGRRVEPGKGPGQYVGSNGFGLQCADVNSDGLMDVYATTISHPDREYSRMWSDPTQLLINQGPREGYRFKNVYLDVGLPFNEGDLDGAVVDFDNDGRMDLSVSRESKYEARGTYFMDDQLSWFGLMHQLPDGAFESVGMISGINDKSTGGNGMLPRLKGGHQHAWSDIDGDGDLDLLVGGLHRGGIGRPNFLLRNDIGSRNAWLAVRLLGDGEHVNRDAIGARVQLVYPDRTLRREVKSSRGMFNSMDTRVLHFGLGNLGCAPRVLVQWPDGTIFQFSGGEFGQNRLVTIEYGDGEPLAPTPTPTPTHAPVVIPTSHPSPTPGPRTYIYLPVAYNGLASP